MGLTQSTISPTSNLISSPSPSPSITTSVLHTMPIVNEHPQAVSEPLEVIKEDVSIVLEADTEKLFDTKASEVFETAIEQVGTKIEVQPVDVAESADVVKKSKKNKNKNKANKV